MFLSFDIGTTKICVLICDPSAFGPAAVAGMMEAENGSDTANSAGRHEQSADKAADRALLMARKLLERFPESAKRIRGISVTGQMHGVLPCRVAADGRLAAAGPLVTWRDARASGTVAGWQRFLGPEAPTRTGCRLCSGYGGLTLAWMAERKEWPEGAVAASMADYLAARLTGVLATETTHAASWGLLDLASGAWDEAACEALGVRAWLPEVKPSAGALAPLSRQAAEMLGLSGTDVMVHSPVGDNQASFVGATAAPGPDSANAVAVNLGTGGQVSWPLPPSSPVVADGNVETRPMPGGNRIGVAASLCGGWSWQYLARLLREMINETLGRELPMNDVYTALNRMAAKAPPGAGGLSWSPLFMGTRADGAQRGRLSGMDESNLRPANLARAMAEGMAEELAGHFWKAMGPAAGSFGRLVASGNGVRKNTALQEALSRAFGKPCAVTPDFEEAAVGAAFCAAKSMGLA